MARADEDKVRLTRYDIGVELTPSAHASIYRFTFPESDDAHLVIDAGHTLVRDIVPAIEGSIEEASVAIDPLGQEVTGHRYYLGVFGGETRVFLCAQFDRPPTDFGTWINGKSLDRCWLRQKDITGPTKLAFAMSEIPTTWGRSTPPPLYVNSP